MIDKAQSDAQKFLSKHIKHYIPKRTLSPGDKIMLDSHNLKVKTPSRKLSPRWYGPFKVLKQVSPAAYCIELPLSMKIHNVFHIDLLILYNETEAYGVGGPSGSVVFACSKGIWWPLALAAWGFRFNPCHRWKSPGHHMPQWVSHHSHWVMGAQPARDCLQVDKGYIILGNGFKNKLTTWVDRPPRAWAMCSQVVSQTDSHLTVVANGTLIWVKSGKMEI